MLTIGDSFSVVAILVGLAATAWSFLMFCALVMPNQVGHSRDAIAASGWKAFGTGLLTMVPFAIGLAFMSVPLLPVKAIGWLMVLAHMMLSFAGTAGIVRLMSERHFELANSMQPVASLSRSAGYLVTACLLPLLGWFLVAPVLYLLGAGAATLGLIAPRRAQGVVIGSPLNG